MGAELKEQQKLKGRITNLLRNPLRLKPKQKQIDATNKKD